MLNVYLDQNKWIDLARTDHDRNERFRDVLDLALEGTRQGFLRFPLSSVHYMETWNHRRCRRRHELASTMLKIARTGAATGPHTIANSGMILASEMDDALQSRFGRPIKVRACQIFGEGVNHAFGKEAIRYEVPWLLPLSTDQRHKVERLGSSLLEGCFGRSG